MNFRVNLAVAFAAALSFACADKQAVIPELEEAMIAPPGLTVVGLYSMEVTPVEGSGGRQFTMQAIPIGRDGNSATNPNGTLQVAGTFSAVTTAGPGACAGQQALVAPVEIKNFAVDGLTNVWVDVLSIMGTTGTFACNSEANLLASGLGFVEADKLDGLWKYPNLAGAPNSAGTAAGGAGIVNWGFLFNNATPFRFFFRVMANVNEPAVDGGLIVGPTVPLTWRSPGAKSTILQVCSVAPVGQANCPVALSHTVQLNSASLVAPFFFSTLLPALTDGATYYARATNVWAGGVSKFPSPWVPFTYSAGVPVVAAAAIPANVGASVNGFTPINWTTLDDGNFLQWTYVLMCLGPCPANPPGARPLLTFPNILFDGPISTTLINGANAEYSLFVPTDLFQPLPVDATGLYYDPAAVIDFRVYAYDGFSAAPAFGAPHGTNAVTIAPVQNAPAFVPPLSFPVAAPSWPLPVTADPGFANVLVQVCVPNCTLDAPSAINGANLFTPPGGISFPLTAGVGTVDFKTIPGIAALPATSTFEFLVFNPDLYQIYPAVPTAASVQ